MTEAPEAGKQMCHLDGTAWFQGTLSIVCKLPSGKDSFLFLISGPLLRTRGLQPELMSP